MNMYKCSERHVEQFKLNYYIRNKDLGFINIIVVLVRNLQLHSVREVQNLFWVKPFSIAPEEHTALTYLKGTLYKVECMNIQVKVNFQIMV